MTVVERQDEDIPSGTCKCPDPFEQPISYKFLADGDIGYIQWRSFAELPVNINVFEKFLETMQGREGMIIDLRGNSGGLLQLLYTMASYFFPADKSVPYQWLDVYNYDEEAHGFVKERGANLQLYAPRPDLAYTGKLVVLVNDFTASAGEYFPQFLQKMKRATIIGEYASEGAGGSVNVVTLTGPIPFAYTGGRSFFAGTQEPNLEAKGVQLDIRVPITLENERKKKNCQDPVIEAAIEFLKK
jgi:C-terminal processing protease CtpA/Prc